MYVNSGMCLKLLAHRCLFYRFSDVYVFTVPLYLPKQDSDGKWRTVSLPSDFACVHFADGRTRRRTK